MKNQAALQRTSNRITQGSAIVRAKTSAFVVGFIITLLIAALLTFSLTTLYRMENTVAPIRFEVLKIEKNQVDKLKIIILNKEYLFDTSKNLSLNDKLLNYDALIPIEIRTFFMASKAASDAVADWLYNTF